MYGLLFQTHGYRERTNSAHLNSEAKLYLVGVIHFPQSSNRLCARKLQTGYQNGIQPVTGQIGYSCLHTAKTDKCLLVSKKCIWDYNYFGIVKVLVAIKLNSQHPVLDVHINIDGLPLYQPKGADFWPILKSFNGSAPVMIALYYSLRNIIFYPMLLITVPCQI